MQLRVQTRHEELLENERLRMRGRTGRKRGEAVNEREMLEKVDKVYAASDAFHERRLRRLAAPQTHDEYRARLDREAFDKATKIDAKDYTGWVSRPGHDEDEAYFESVEALLVYCADNELPRPAFVWACKSFALHVNADFILEQALEEHAENAGDSITTTEVERLQAFLDEWAAKQDVVSWDKDRERAVMIPLVDESEVER